MKQIILASGESTLIDDIDYDYCNQYAWHQESDGYAYAWINGKNVSLHSVIAERMGLIKGKYEVFDHKDRNHLNNQRNNFRVVTQGFNRFNSKVYSNNACGVKGVAYYTTNNMYRAHISFNKRYIHLGYFKTFEEAVAKRREAELLYYGEHPH